MHIFATVISMTVLAKHVPRAIGKPSSKSNWIHREDDRLLVLKCTIAERIAGRSKSNSLLFIGFLFPSSWRACHFLSICSFHESNNVFWQMKLATQQPSWCPHWPQQWLVLLSMWIMVWTPWDSQLTAGHWQHKIRNKMNGNLHFSHLWWCHWNLALEQLKCYNCFRF